MVLPLFAESKACQSLAEINILYYLSENPAFSGTETESGPFASIACFFFNNLNSPCIFQQANNQSRSNYLCTPNTNSAFYKQSSVQSHLWSL